MREKPLSFNRRHRTWFTYLNMIPGWHMGLRWGSSPVGIRIRDSSWTARESLLDWDSALDYSAASAGVFTIGDTIGIAAGESFSTTTHSSRTAGRSSIATILVVGRISITPAIFAAEVLTGMKG